MRFCVRHITGRGRFHPINYVGGTGLWPVRRVSPARVSCGKSGEGNARLSEYPIPLPVSNIEVQCGQRVA